MIVVGQHDSHAILSRQFVLEGAQQGESCFGQHFRDLGPPRQCSIDADNAVGGRPYAARDVACSGPPGFRSPHECWDGGGDGEMVSCP